MFAAFDWVFGAGAAIHVYKSFFFEHGTIVSRWFTWLPLFRSHAVNVKAVVDVVIASNPVPKPP